MNRNKVHFKETVAVDIEDLKSMLKILNSVRKWTCSDSAADELSDTLKSFLEKYLPNG